MRKTSIHSVWLELREVKELEFVNLLDNPNHLFKLDRHLQPRDRLEEAIKDLSSVHIYLQELQSYIEEVTQEKRLPLSTLLDDVRRVHNELDEFALRRIHELPHHLILSTKKETVPCVKWSYPSPLRLPVKTQVVVIKNGR